jgi:hypothetical protein
MARNPMPIKKQRRAADVDYEIVRIDPDTKEIDVVFDGNPNDWARVPLTDPRLGPPATTIEEIEARIQVFTPKKEEIEAMHSDLDVSLVESLVGQRRNLKRFSAVEKAERDKAETEAREAARIAEIKAQELQPVDRSEELQIAEEQWISQVVEKTIEAMIASGKLATGFKK